MKDGGRRKLEFRYTDDTQPDRIQMKGSQMSAYDLLYLRRRETLRSDGVMKRGYILYSWTPPTGNTT